jgi:Cys-rich repeat protein
MRFRAVEIEVLMRIFLAMLFVSLISNGCTPSIYKCTSDFDCKAGYLCRMEADVGSECGIKTIADVKKPQIEPKEIISPPPVMRCQTDSDCGNGRSCRSAVGGGTECKVKSVSNLTSPDKLLTVRPFFQEKTRFSIP